MKKLQDKLDLLLEKYSVGTKAVFADENTVVIDGEKVPLLSHRAQRRFTELADLTKNGTLEDVSVMRTARIVPKGGDISAELYRELDLCAFILGRDIETVTAMRNGPVINVIARAEGGTVCTIEISAVLPEGETPKDKHEIISRRGVACDVGADAQLRQSSIYVFGKENEKYTDVDFELYGLDENEAASVRAAFAAAKAKDFAERKLAHERAEKLSRLSVISAETGERQVL